MQFTIQLTVEGQDEKTSIEDYFTSPEVLCIPVWQWVLDNDPTFLKQDSQ